MAGGDPHQISVRVQVLGGVWETIGSDRYVGVATESVQYSANASGFDTASFTLRRDPAAVHPDLLAWTPVEIWVAGFLAWDGRVKETPAQEGADFTLNVNCEGWQYHLDDDLFQRPYIHAGMSDFQDVRQLPTANLTTVRAYGQVSVDTGSVTLMAANGTTVPINTGVAAVVDLGPDGGCIQPLILLQSSNNATNAKLYVIGSDTPYWDNSLTSNASRYDWVSNQAMNTSPTFAVLPAAAPRPYRYVSLVLWFSAGATFTADVWLKFGSEAYTAGLAGSGVTPVVGLPLAGATGYLQSGGSVLTPTQVVQSVLPYAPKLSASTASIQDTSAITADNVVIPDFSTSGYQTPRDVATAANAFENYELKVLTGRRLAFRPRAAAPVYEIGEWSGADLADASTNSSDDIFNKAIIQATGPDGQALSVTRTAAQQPGARPLIATSDVTVSNPGFEVNTTGWVAAGTTSTITRDTTQFDTGVASGRWDGANDLSGGNPQVSTTLSGTFFHGSTYRLQVAVRPSGGGSYGVQIYLGSVHVPQVAQSIPGNTWTTLTLSVTPTNDIVNPGLVINSALPGVVPAATYYIDSVVIYEATPTLPDRWGFSRSVAVPVSSMLTLPIAQRIGDLYLAAHRTTPFRGSFNATPGGVRNVLGGATPHPAWLAANTGQLVRVAKIDPDTGAWGRTGTIAAVTYDHDNLTAQVSLDENRQGFDTLLNRLAVVTSLR